MATEQRAETSPTLIDWALLAVVVSFGGSAFAMIRVAVETTPPLVITIARLWVGAAFLYVVMRRAGRRLPPLIDPGSRLTIQSEWRWMLAVSVIGYVIPFIMFPLAQQHIESGLAGIYMAFMPIWTVGLAYLFAGEQLSFRKIFGFAMGFAGVIVLIGPSVFGDAASSNILAQIMLLIATFGYAASAVLTRRAPAIRPRVFAAGTVLAAALITTPMLLLIDLRIEHWTIAGILNVIGLGLGPTGFGSVVLIILIQRVGAGFMALANYLTPLWAVIMGAALFGERLNANALIALFIILVGVAVSQTRRKRAKHVVLAQEMGENVVISEKRKSD